MSGAETRLPFRPRAIRPGKRLSHMAALSRLPVCVGELRVFSCCRCAADCVLGARRNGIHARETLILAGGEQTFSFEVIERSASEKGKTRDKAHSAVEPDSAEKSFFPPNDRSCSALQSEGSCRLFAVTAGGNDR